MPAAGFIANRLTASIKARDTGNPAWNVWLRWNTDRVTVFVRELRAALGTTGHKVPDDAAVFPDAVNARVAIGQDWAAWGREAPSSTCSIPCSTRTTLKLYETLAREAVGYAQGANARLPGDRRRNLAQPDHARGPDRAGQDHQSPGRGWRCLLLVLEPDAAIP